MARRVLGTRNLVHAMDEEWAVMADVTESSGANGRGLRRLVRSWAARYEILADCSTPADVLAQVHRHPDLVLGLLIEIEHTADRPASSLAGRIVLQAMLGKMVRMARRDPMAEVDDYVTQLWCRLRDYPLARRPHRIAANLALDTLKAVHAERATGPEVGAAGPGDRVRSWDELADDQPTRPVDLSAVRVLRTASAMGLIDDSTHWLLAAVYADGWSGKEVAAQLQVSHETVRFRCSRAVRGLAREAVSLAAGARWTGSMPVFGPGEAALARSLADTAA